MLNRTFFFCLILIAFNQNLASQSFDAEIIKYATFCEVDKDKLTQIDTVTIQVNNRNGDNYTNITIPYSKSEKVSDLEAWIEDMNGNKIRDLKKSDIVDKSAISDISLYEDNFNKCFQLKHNIYPYKVTYTYKTTYKNYIAISWWTPIIYNAIPTRAATLKAILPKYFQIFKYVNNVSDFRTDSTETSIILEWKTSYPKPIENEIFSQPENFKPLVIITPLYFNYGCEGCSKDWVSYGNWQYKLMQGLDILPEDEKRKISFLIKGITDKKEVVKVLYHYLQDNTRYINVSIGIGGLKPYPASYVAMNKYGDCKALTNYMKAMLSYAGIESYYTKVNASSQPEEIIKSIAGPQFNHIVLAVPVDNDTIWLENTQKTNPFGYMGTYTQNREALLVSKDQSKLVRIPGLKVKDNCISNKVEFELNTDGSSNVSLHSSLRGSVFEAFNQLHDEFNEDEKDRILRNYLQFDNCEVNNWKIIKPNRDSARIELIAELSLYKVLKPLEKDFYLSLFPIDMPSFTIPAKRKLPVILPYPIFSSDTIIYHIPVGYGFKTKLDTFSIKSQYGNYKLNMNLVDGKIYAIKSFELYSGSYSTDQYADFYSFIKSAIEIDRMNIVIKPLN